MICQSPPRRRHGSREVLRLDRHVPVRLDEAVEIIRAGSRRVEDRHGHLHPRAARTDDGERTPLGARRHLAPPRVHLDAPLSFDRAARDADLQPRVPDLDGVLESLLPAIEDVHPPRLLVVDAQRGQDRRARALRPARLGPLDGDPHLAVGPGPGSPARPAWRSARAGSRTCSRCGSGPSCGSTSRRRASRCTHARGRHRAGTALCARSARSLADARPCTAYSRFFPTVTYRSFTTAQALTGYSTSW